MGVMMGMFANGSVTSVEVVVKAAVSLGDGLDSRATAREADGCCRWAAVAVRLTGGVGKNTGGSTARLMIASMKGMARRVTAITLSRRVEAGCGLCLWVGFGM